MKVVFLSYCFPPLRYPRAIQVAHLAGHSRLESLEVLAGDERSAGDESLLSLVPDELVVRRLPWTDRANILRELRARTIKDRFLVPDHFRPWARDAGAELAGTLRREDVLVSFGQPMSDHLAALRAVAATGATWIAHFSDPWSLSPFRHGARITRWINRTLERRVLAAADRVVFTSEQTLALVAAGDEALRVKASVLPHAFDPNLYPVPKTQPSAQITLRYVGNFYGHRTAEPLFAGLAALTERAPATLRSVRVELIGSFETDPLELPSARRLPAGLVSVRGPVAYQQSLAEMAGADLLAVIDAPAAESVFLPSKLIEYAGARRPVIAITPRGPSANLVSSLGGWVADPADPASVATALERALAAAARWRGRPWGDGAVLARFAAPEIAKRFDELVADAVRSR